MASQAMRRNLLRALRFSFFSRGKGRKESRVGSVWIFWPARVAMSVKGGASFVGLLCGVAARLRHPSLCADRADLPFKMCSICNNRVRGLPGIAIGLVRWWRDVRVRRLDRAYFFDLGQVFSFAIRSLALHGAALVALGGLACCTQGLL